MATRTSRLHEPPTLLAADADAASAALATGRCRKKVAFAGANNAANIDVDILEFQSTASRWLNRFGSMQKCP